MKNYIILVILLFFIFGCDCENRREIDGKFRKWAAYTSTADLIYFSNTGLEVDTLSFTKLDRDDEISYNGLGTCKYHTEHMFCTQKSMRYKSLSFSISLTPPSFLWFALEFENKGSCFTINLKDNLNQNLYKINTNNNKVAYFDTIRINSVQYYSVFNLTDSARELGLFYSPDGIIGYVIDKDTMLIDKK